MTATTLPALPHLPVVPFTPAQLQALPPFIVCSQNGDQFTCRSIGYAYEEFARRIEDNAGEPSYWVTLWERGSVIGMHQRIDGVIAYDSRLL
jgi:hypothetical protein